MSKDNSNQYPLNIGYSQGFEDQSNSNTSQYDSASNQSVVYNQPQYNGNPQSEPEKKGQSALAITGFVLSLIGCTYIAGIILGIIDLVRTKGRKNGLAIAAVAIGGAWVLLSCALVVIVYSGDKANEKAEKAVSYYGGSIEKSTGDITKPDDEAIGSTVSESVEDSIEQLVPADGLVISKPGTKLEDYTLGEPLHISTSGGDFTISFTDIKEDVVPARAYENGYRRFVTISYSVENISYNGNLHIAVYDFDAYDSNGSALDTRYSASDSVSISKGHNDSSELSFWLNSDTDYVELEFSDGYGVRMTFSVIIDM